MCIQYMYIWWQHGGGGGGGWLLCHTAGSKIVERNTGVREML